MASIPDVERIPVTPGTASHPLLGDVAQVNYGNVVGEYHRLNGQRIVTLTANVSGQDLGRVSKQWMKQSSTRGVPPRGVKVAVRGQIGPMSKPCRAWEWGCFSQSWSSFCFWLPISSR